MDSKKVLIVIEKYPPDFTGAGIRAHRQVLSLKNRYGRHFEILTFDTQVKDKNTLSTRNINGICVNTLAPPPRRNKNTYILQPLKILFIFWQVMKFFKKNRRFKIVHGFTMGWLVINTILIGKLFGLKIIVEQTLLLSDDAITLTKKNWLHFIGIGWFKFLVLRFIIDKIVCLSSILESLNRKIGIPKDKIWTRPNPVDPNCFFPVSQTAKKKLRVQLNLPEKGIILLNIGRIGKRKNQRFIVESMQTMEHHSSITLLIIGPLHNSDINEYKEIMALKKRFSKNIHLIVIPESKPNIFQFMQASDLFVFASKREGFCNVLLEALMSGLPIVMLPLPSISDMLIWNEKCGISIKTDNQKEFAENIKTQIHRIVSEKTSFELHKETKKRFDNKKIMQAYESIYRYLER